MAMKQSPDDVVIVGAKRTPQGKILGQLSNLSAVDLGAVAIAAAVESSGVAVTDIDHVVFGQVIQAGQGQNPARQSAVKSGLPLNIPATTVNVVCLSGLRAIVDAARLIRLGEAAIVVAGGQESMTNSPHLIPDGRKGKSYGALNTQDSIEWDALTDAFEHLSMGVMTESGNQERGISRASQDEVAARSHQLAAQAQEAGLFNAEIASVTVTQRRGEDLHITADEGIRAESTTETLGRLRAAFTADGTITAGNASPISDGAAAVVMMKRRTAESRNLNILATLAAAGEVAGPDTSLHSQPARAIHQALERSGWNVEELDFVEINEAFASVVVQSLQDLDYPLERTNIHGGAIAMGHPVGASGARLVVHAAHELARRRGGRAAVSLCGGGGQGEALLLWV